MKTATYRRGSGGLLTRAAAFGLLALAATLCTPGEARAQWATNGNNINSTNTGNVGVGTAAPEQSLHVSGTEILSTGFGSGFKFRDRNSATSADDWVWYSQGNVARFWRAGTGDLFGVTPSGSLGVGTLTPGKKLEVLAPNGEAARLYRNASNAGWGVNITFALNNSNNARTDYAGVHGLVGNPAAGAEAGHLVFTTATGGALTEKMRIDHVGNVGVGTTSTTYARLNVNKAIRIDDDSGSLVGSDTIGAAPNIYFGTINGGAVFQWNAAGGLDLWQYVGGWTRPFTFTKTGNLGIGTNNPAARLDVNGDIRVSGNINAKYQDVAEWVPTTQKLQAGTVVVLDTRHSNHVAASSSAYDTRVAGVISAQPGISLGEAGEGKVLVATTGRVRVRVDATRAPIQIGDLIVTSDAEGVAMKSEPIRLGGRQIHAPGTIIGKALEPLEKGTGEILVLLSLQ